MNAFGFQFSEDTLRQSLAEIAKQREIDPQGVYALEFSVSVEHDGVGFAFYEPHASIVKIVEEQVIDGPPDRTVEMVEALPVEETLVDELPTMPTGTWLTPVESTIVKVTQESEAHP